MSHFSIFLFTISPVCIAYYEDKNLNLFYLWKVPEIRSSKSHPQFLVEYYGRAENVFPLQHILGISTGKKTCTGENNKYATTETKNWRYVSEQAPNNPYESTFANQISSKRIFTLVQTLVLFVFYGKTVLNFNLCS